MFKFIGYVVVILGIFGGGFYSGVTYHEHDMVKNPGKYAQLYKQEFSKNAKDKLKKLKKIVRDKLE